jgi:hypothetical protein
MPGLMSLGPASGAGGSPADRACPFRALMDNRREGIRYLRWFTRPLRGTWAPSAALAGAEGVATTDADALKLTLRECHSRWPLDVAGSQDEIIAEAAAVAAQWLGLRDTAAHELDAGGVSPSAPIGAA